MKLNFLRQYFNRQYNQATSHHAKRSGAIDPSTSDDGNRKGQQAEQLCKAYLLKNGWQLIGENFSCKLGEIDLIMRKAEQLLFIEVRYRKNTIRGSGAASVTAGKQKKLRSAIQFFLQATPGYSSQSSAYRIDVMEVSPAIGRASVPSEVDNCEFEYANHNIRWIKNAFS